MNKSLKKILFTVLTIFAVFFVVACGNKEDTNINKEEVFQKSVEANNNIKSADLVTTVNMTPKKGGESINVTVTASLIVDPLTLKMTMETKGQNVKINSFIKDDIILMCSDGLTNMIREENIYEIIKQDKENAIENLVKQANDNGGLDNITVVIIM